MSRLDAFSYWASLSADCWVLSLIGWGFGIRFTRIFPALLATTALSLALLIVPQISAVLSPGGTTWRELESALRDCPAHFYAFCAMTLVLSIFGFEHSCHPELASDTEAEASEEGTLDAGLYPSALPASWNPEPRPPSSPSHDPEPPIVSPGSAF